MESAIRSQYSKEDNTGIKSDLEFMNSVKQRLWDSCIRDGKIAKTWFKLIFGVAFSKEEEGKIGKTYADDIINLLCEDGVIIEYDKLSNMYKNDQDDSRKKKLAAVIRQREFFIDLLLQLLLQARSKSTIDLEYIYTISAILKDGRTVCSNIDTLNKIHLCVSSSNAREVSNEMLSSYYKNNIENLNDIIQQTKQVAVVNNDTSQIIKKNIMILLIDNYASTQYAQESKQTKSAVDEDGESRVYSVKQFSKSVDSLSIMAIPVEKPSDFNTSYTRPSATVNMLNDKINDVKVLDEVLKIIIEDRSFELKDQSLKDAKFTGEFPHLSDYIKLASMPVKSSSHNQILQLLQVIVKNYFDGENNETVLAVDTEFVLEAIVYSIVLPDFMHNIIISFPPFHLQKHAQESLDRQLVFIRAIKALFCRAIHFKPSIYNSDKGTGEKRKRGINERIDDGCLVYENKLASEAFVSTSSDLVEVENIEMENNFDEQLESLVALDEITMLAEIVESNNSKTLDQVDETLIAEQFQRELVDNLLNFQAKTEYENHLSNLVKEETTEEAVQKMIKSISTLIDVRIKTIKFDEEVAMKSKLKKDKNDKSSNTIDVPSQPPSLIQIQAKERDWIKCLVSNQQRLKYNDELLFSVFKESEAELKDFWNKNSLTKLIFSLCNEQLRIAVEPFDLWNGDGNLKPFLDALPKLVVLYSVGKKPKVVRAALFLVAELVHLNNNRQDILKFLIENAPLLNEVFIEHHNSTIARKLENLSNVDIQIIRNVSIETDRVRSFRNNFTEFLETKDALKKVPKTKEMHSAPKSQALSLIATNYDSDTEGQKIDPMPSSTDRDDSSSQVYKRHDSECRAQVTRRTNPDGSSKNLIKCLSRYFFVPLIKKFATFSSFNSSA